MASTAVMQKLLVRTTATCRNAGGVASRSLAGSSLAATTTTRPMFSCSCQYNRSFSIAAATGVKSMMYATSSSSSSSYLDSILDPSAPASLFGSSSSSVEDEEPSAVLPRSNKFLKCGISENVLRFKTQSYGRLLNAPFVHANEHRVILLMSIDELPLVTRLEHDIFQEIVGAQRYNRERNELRLQSVQFGSRIENKRHLVSMLDRLVLSCQTLAKQVVTSMEKEKEQGPEEMKNVV